MARIKIPVLDENINTSNPSGAVKDLGMGAVGVAILFGLVAGGQFLYNRARSAAGMGQDDQPVPGV